MNFLNIQVGVIPRCNEINGQHENTLPWRRSFAAPSEWGAASLACWEVYDTWSLMKSIWINLWCLILAASLAWKEKQARNNNFSPLQVKLFSPTGQILYHQKGTYEFAMCAAWISKSYRCQWMPWPTLAFLQSPELINFFLSHRLGAYIKEIDIQARMIPPEIQNQVH